MKILAALVIGGLAAIGVGFLVWELPKDTAPRFVTLEVIAGEPLAGAGILMLDCGVVSYNGSTLSEPAIALYVLGNEIAHLEPDGWTWTTADVRLPVGPATTDRNLLRDPFARARFRSDPEGFLDSLEVRGTDHVTGRLFSVRTIGTRGEGPDRRLRLELETWHPESDRP